jgi:hypothetical protein
LSSPLTCGSGFSSIASGVLSTTTQAAGQAFGLGMGGTLTGAHDLHVILVRTM